MGKTNFSDISLDEVAPIATTDATDAAETMALTNEIKAKLNSILNG